MYLDVGIVQPVVCAHHVGEPAERTVGREFLQDLDLAETLAELQQHVEGLTLGILDARIKELP